MATSTYADIAESLGLNERKQAKRPRHASEPTRVSLFGDISRTSADRLPDPLVIPDLTAELRLESMTESIIFWLTREFGTKSFVDAQAEFHHLSGRFFHDDPIYHERTTYFLDYFIYERPFHERKTPFELFLGAGVLESIPVTYEVQRAFERLAVLGHSLYKIKKIDHDKMILVDALESRIVYEVRGEKSFFGGFEEGLYIQCFVFPLGGAFCLSQGVLFHPKSCMRVIAKYLAEVQKDNPTFKKTDVLFPLARRNLDLLRHRNLEAKVVYSWLLAKNKKVKVATEKSA